MDWLQNIPWGSILTAVITLVLAWFASSKAYTRFGTSTTIRLAAIEKKYEDALALAEKEKTREKAAHDATVMELNRRISDLAAGTLQHQTELREFKAHVDKHNVEKDEISDLRLSVDKSIDRMQSSLDLATATMGDVRDAVLVLTATNGKPSVPPARRRPTKIS